MRVVCTDNFMPKSTVQCWKTAPKSGSNNPPPGGSEMDAVNSNDTADKAQMDKSAETPTGSDQCFVKNKLKTEPYLDYPSDGLSETEIKRSNEYVKSLIKLCRERFLLEALRYLKEPVQREDICFAADRAESAAKCLGKLADLLSLHYEATVEEKLCRLVEEADEEDY
jgi:hypothetical protein